MLDVYCSLTKVLVIGSNLRFYGEFLTVAFTIRITRNGANIKDIINEEMAVTIKCP